MHIKPTTHQLHIPANSYYPPGTGSSIAIGEMKHYHVLTHKLTSSTVLNQNIKQSQEKRVFSKIHQINKFHFSGRISELELKNRDKKRNILPFVTRFASSAARAM